MKTQWLANLVLLTTTLTLAAPPRLTVQPKGTNQVELTFGPVLPHVMYEVLARTNGPNGHWITFAGCYGSTNKTALITANVNGIQGLTLQTLSNWNFVAGRWDVDQGDGLPAIYKELVLRTDPFADGDPYGDLMGDGWNNLEKMQLNMDPFTWYPPPKANIDVKFRLGANGGRYGSAILTWQCRSGTIPDYFVIERANRTRRFMPRTLRHQPRFRGFKGRYGRPGWQRESPFVTGPFEIVARIPGRSNVRDYEYVETNVDTFAQPLYRIQPHYSPPLHARLDRVDTTTIRKTMLPVTAKPTTNGYDLTVRHPIPYAWYLLLVRDKTDPQWRASGYFASGTNRNPVYLHVDKTGMMSEDQSPITMPAVKFLPDVVDPEFTAGWGEDSDGDGLPDIYEVLVTHTDPDNADTGHTGILDGYKDLSGDGWDNLEKFRRRADPLLPAHPPPTVELKHPTTLEILKAISPQSDLHYEIHIEIRTNGEAGYQPIEQVPQMFYQVINFRQRIKHTNFDLRISWRFPDADANEPGSYPDSELPTPMRTLESIEGKVNLELVEAFKASLATNPPLSRTEIADKGAAIMKAYRRGEMDKGVAMVEFMALKDDQAQDFYGKVVDQHEQPVAGAEVTIKINLAMGLGSTQKTQTDANGLFQFIGIRGESLSITPEKKGYQIERSDLGLKGQNGPETSLNNRAIFRMRRLRE